MEIKTTITTIAVTSGVIHLEAIDFIEAIPGGYAVWFRGGKSALIGVDDYKRLSQYFIAL